MDTKKRTFNGRDINQEDVELIQWIVSTYKNLSLTELAATVSESLEWVQKDGKAKVNVGLACLESLQEEGLVSLPNKKNTVRSTSTISFIEMPVEPEITSCGPITLAPAANSQERLRWRSYVNQYHMLGYKLEFGCRLQYFIRSEGIDLGCIQFSASAWALSCRDRWIGWTEKDRKVRLELITNNSRYLIFPWVKVPCLASRALGLAARQIRGDWLQTYGFAPVLLETFVDTEHFKGTCYKAANWILLGNTVGRGRMDRYNESALSSKAVYVYPLQKDFREVLMGQKAPKEMEI